MNDKHLTESEGPFLTIIVPAYNEPESGAKTAASLLEAVQYFEEPVEIIFIDDGSTDSTYAELVRIKGIRVLRHVTNRGYGAALKTGILASSSEWIAITDADSTYPIERIAHLLKMARNDGLEMAIGARIGPNVHIPMVRRPVKWIITKLASFLSGRRIPDLNSGFRVFRRESAIEYLDILPDGFSFTSTITIAFISNGYMIDYLPIDYHKRTGRSKIKPIHDTLNFMQLIVRMVMYFNPLRVFLPISLAFFALSLAAVIYRAYHGGLAVVSIVFFIAGVQMLSIGMIADLIDQRIRLRRNKQRNRIE
jgi:glycosyltransferase involved in cell wall biosynthesis